MFENSVKLLKTVSESGHFLSKLIHGAIPVFTFDEAESSSIRRCVVAVMDEAHGFSVMASVYIARICADNDRFSFGERFDDHEESHRFLTMFVVTPH